MTADINTELLDALQAVMELPIQDPLRLTPEQWAIRDRARDVLAKNGVHVERVPRVKSQDIPVEVSWERAKARARLSGAYATLIRDG